jgi:hypothetical protein
MCEVISRKQRDHVPVMHIAAPIPYMTVQLTVEVMEKVITPLGCLSISYLSPATKIYRVMLFKIRV